MLASGVGTQCWGKEMSPRSPDAGHLKAWFLDQRYPRPLGTYCKCQLLGPAPGRPRQTLGWAQPPALSQAL